MADTVVPSQPVELKGRNVYVSSPSGLRPAKETTFREWVVANQIGMKKHLSPKVHMETTEKQAAPDRVAALPNESLAYAKSHILRILVSLTPVASLQEYP